MKNHLKKVSLAIGSAALLGVAGTASATDLVVVSWGGAYTASQQKAYHEPYMAANSGINIINDDSAADGISKIRAMSEAGNVSWALVDMVASDAILLCEEGLLEPIDHNAVLAAAPDGTPASEDFGDLIVSECFVPQIVYSTTFGYRTDLVKEAPTSIADVFDLEKIPGKRSLEKRPIGNLEWAMIAAGVNPDDVDDVLD
ncbi:MAG: extracellular solute-binding protein, partial [Gammaproteobacteria bacterium]|nr:extracellular solute-binding protein [Gammaproteobacteria bacterium]